jgi:DNA-binding FadR family transcriptional regulator
MTASSQLAVARDLPAVAKRPEVRPGTKLATTVARWIVADVIALGWPVGRVLGSESDLLKRYGVSRAVFREAVRLVENQQVATMRRGRGGGLVVTEPTVEAIIDAAVLYLYRADARLDEVFEARLVLEEIVTDITPGRLTEADVAELRQLVDDEETGRVKDHRALHTLLASMTQNPALELFVDILNKVPVLYFRDASAFAPTTIAESNHAHARIADAVIAGNAGLAQHRMRTHLQAEAEYLRGRRSSRQQLPTTVSLGGGVSNKRAEDVARSVLHDIIAEDIPVGQLLGSETELIDRYGVSRAVFREAVRLLEHHHIAMMRRGTGGGMFVTAPSAEAVSDVAAVYLARRGMRVGDLAELRAALELVLVELAARRIDDQGAAVLRDALERERTVSDTEFADAGHDLHGVLAGLAGNKALELVALVLIRLTRLHQIDRLSAGARKKVAAEVPRTHEGIADAVIDGDGELARYRLRRHLDVLAKYLR